MEERLVFFAAVDGFCIRGIIKSDQICELFQENLLKKTQTDVMYLIYKNFKEIVENNIFCYYFCISGILPP